MSDRSQNGCSLEVSNELAASGLVDREFSRRDEPGTFGYLTMRPVGARIASKADAAIDAR